MRVIGQECPVPRGGWIDRGTRERFPASDLFGGARIGGARIGGPEGSRKAGPRERNSKCEEKVTKRMTSIGGRKYQPFSSISAYRIPLRSVAVHCVIYEIFFVHYRSCVESRQGRPVVLHRAAIPQV